MDISRLAKDTASEIIETHISWILLNEHAYKVKKPLKFSFLDFSSAEKRRFFCAEEVRLNSRLSPDVYLGVVGIGDGGFCSPDEAPEHAVKMRRLDEGTKMSGRLDSGGITDADVRRLAAAIADFHDKAERAPAYGSVSMISSQAMDLSSHREAIEKASGLGRWVDKLLERSANFIRRNSGLMEERRKGFVKDCHGDLHSANVFFQDGIRIIDCVEFSSDFRCIDVASDLAFMAMDLDYSGRGDLSDLLVQEYVERSGDGGLERLLPFYKCYRANVRAKIAAIEWMQRPNQDARTRIDRYVLLAEKYSKTLS